MRRCDASTRIESRARCRLALGTRNAGRYGHRTLPKGATMRSSRSVRLLATGLAMAASAIAWPLRGEVERINIDALGRNPNFSQATVAAGQLVFVAGTLGTMPASRDLAGG